MILLRLLAALVAVAIVLALVFLVTKERRYLTWSWRIFVVALLGAAALMVFYFVERLFLTG